MSIKQQIGLEDVSRYVTSEMQKLEDYLQTVEQEYQAKGTVISNLPVEVRPYRYIRAHCRYVAFSQINDLITEKRLDWLD